jgi:hypothetical protein
MDFSKEEHIFRKKLVWFAAIQWTGTNFDEIKAFFGQDAERCLELEDATPNSEIKRSLTIKTLEGNHTALPNDFIIRGVKGEYYPCKPDIFEQTYEVVE